MNVIANRVANLKSTNGTLIKLFYQITAVEDAPVLLYYASNIHCSVSHDGLSPEARVVVQLFNSRVVNNNLVSITDYQMELHNDVESRPRSFWGELPEKFVVRTNYGEFDDICYGQLIVQIDREFMIDPVQSTNQINHHNFNFAWILHGDNHTVAL